MAGGMEDNASFNSSIGWDASLTNKYKEVDINDYSRFDKIKDPDAEEDNNTAKTAPLVNDSCRNCGKKGAKLKCSVCKKAVYCARNCQASDWQFHKRTCKKPEPPKKTTPTPSSKPTTTSSSTSSSSTSTSTTTTATTTKKPSSTSSSSSSTTKEVIKGEENAEEMRGYKNGLPYFHRELTEKDQKLIGDIAPKKVEEVPKEMPPANSAGSAWNHAGTFEERNYTKWAQDKLSEMLVALQVKEGNFSASIQTPEKITGDASICVVRGKKRYLYDFEFQLPFEITIGDGVKTYKGSYQMMDISNDEDYEITYTLSKKPKDASELKQVQDFVKSKSSGLQKEVLRVLKEFAQAFQSL